MSSRRRFFRDVFDEDFFKDIEGEIERMEEAMSRSFSEAMKRKPDEGGPFVYGFSMRTTPEGKPVIREFGNVPGIREGVEFEEGEREPLVDVIETDDEVTVIAELPGIEKKDVHLDVSEEDLSIKVDTPQRKYHKELPLPCEVKADTAKANYNNGVLEVKIKRKEKKKEKKGVKVRVD